MEIVNKTETDRKVEVGAIYRHFKGKFYLVRDVAEHTETNEMMVVYKALYAPGTVYVRPIEMFLSEVDKEKYPDAEQKYRFEQCWPE